MAEFAPPRYEAAVTAGGRVERLTEYRPDGASCDIGLESPRALEILRSGQHVVYRLGEEERLYDLPYAEFIELMRRDLLLTPHKVRDGELLDEPEAVPVLRQLLEELGRTAAAFRATVEVNRLAP